MVRLSKSSVILWLPFMLTFLKVVADGDGQKLRRQKREWIIAPRKLYENEDYRGLQYIAKIQSDKQYDSPVSYSLAGPGANQDPVGLFSIEPTNGTVRIHDILDREKTDSYTLIGIAMYSNGKRAERDIELRIVVLDKNDCPPVFSMQQIGEVYEHSAAGTVVMKVNVTDDDEPGTEHTQISFSLVEQSSSGMMFSMNHKTGEIVVRQTSLDRETQDTFTLTVKGTDMNGASGGLSGTGQVVIKLLDINDNIPKLEKDTYEGSVMENTISMEVLRMKAVDLDLMYSDNWLAVFTIVSGNEAGYFHITTDSKTNEGIITIVKALDYEELKVVNLRVSVSNKAEYNFGSVIGGGPSLDRPKIYSVKINVVNQLEGPRFQPAIKVVTISEDKTTISLNKIFTTYAAIDSDTLLTATNVRYAKLYDVDNWLIIDEKTADIRLNKWPDRESKFVVNGTYTAKIVCITNQVHAKTATGTIAIQVQDSNDDCPKLTSTSQTMCHETNRVYVTAVDQDAYPNGAPFNFRVIQAGNKEKWTIERFNDTTAILRHHASLWPGYYQVALEITDQQGKVCGDVQLLDVVVCTCDAANTACLGTSTDTRSTFGPLGVLMLLLGLLLLLLLPLFLLFCLCGGMAAVGDFKPMPVDTKVVTSLISYHTEGQGEDKEVPLLRVPLEMDHGSIHAGDATKYGDNHRLEFGVAVGNGGAGGGFTSMSTTDMYRDSDFHQHMVSRHDHVDGQGMFMGVDGQGMGMGVGGATVAEGQQFSSWHDAGLYGGIALSDSFLEEYYSSKANHAAQHLQQEDAPMTYDYEGEGSLAGSVGCCSLLEHDNDLDFLNDLGYKFRSLAEICRGSSLEAEQSAGVSVCPPRPTPSSGTHIETSLNTSANIHTLTSSGLASSSSSALIKETVLREQGSASLPRVHVQESMLVPSQTLLIQQPAMYYTSTPALYVVEPQPQVLLVDARGAGVGGQVGVGVGQGLVQVAGSYGSQQGMVLVERQVGGGGGAQVLTGTGQAVIGGGGGVVAGGSHTLSGGSQVSHRVGQTMVRPGHFAMGSGMSQGSVTRSKHVRVVESSSAVSEGAAGSAGLTSGMALGRSAGEHSLEVRVPHVEMRAQTGFSLGSGSQAGSVGSDEDSALMAAAGSHGSHTVLVQHEEVCVTERNVETTSIA
ncbi:desmoglein-2-like isoform X2 [Hypomesus transpacificus]|uniref:desmoglein-2-like isoform X2 n=1 Tax=Hypomesus transpacificus TaxID=137520 RepID=UPI001F086684|nr:desmoglein-2-like isoform X2 [Hypomesus transpacificus]